MYLLQYGKPAILIGVKCADQHVGVRLWDDLLLVSEKLNEVQRVDKALASRIYPVECVYDTEIFTEVCQRLLLPLAFSLRYCLVVDDAGNFFNCLFRQDSSLLSHFFGQSIFENLNLYYNLSFAY